MKGTIRATVKVAGHQVECRFAKGTPKRIVDRWKDRERTKLQKRHPQPELRKPAGTLAADAARYYPLIKHLEDWITRRSEIRSWLPALGETHRHMITREDILRIRGEWIHTRTASPKTINNRVTALRNLYHVLDDDEAPTPCDGVKPLLVTKVPPQIVTPDVVIGVANILAERAKTGPVDRARLMVLATTGKRPCELMRAKPGDVDLRRRVWIVRDAKGGFSPGTFLNDEMIAAWEAFIDADAWGAYNTTHFARRLYRVPGWPQGVRPYNLRHATWIEASERGNDLADVQVGCGHKHMSTTRIHYVPVLNSRMQKMSESLDGRFGWKPAQRAVSNRLAPTKESA